MSTVNVRWQKVMVTQGQRSSRSGGPTDEGNNLDIEPKGLITAS